MDNYDFGVLDSVLDEKPALSNDILTLTKEQLIPDENQPRIKFNEDALKELAASMDQEEQLETIKIYPTPDENNRYIIFNGERRWRSLDYTKKVKSLRAEKINPDAIKINQVTQYHFNNFAEKNDVVEVAAICDTLKKEGLSNKEIALKMSLNNAELSRLLKIHNMPTIIEKLYLDNIVTASRQLYLLCQCFETGNEQTIEYIDRIRAKGGVTVKELETLKSIISDVEEGSKKTEKNDTIETDELSQTTEKIEKDPPIEHSTTVIQGSGDNDSLQSKAEHSDLNTDESNSEKIEVSNVRIESNGKTGYLITRKRSDNDNAYVLFDDDVNESLVKMKHLNIVQIV